MLSSYAGGSSGVNKENNKLNVKSTALQGTATASELLLRSSKLQVVDSLLTELHLKKIPREKVVVVSNFTSMLDHVQVLALERGWGILRIDGSVPTDKRQGLVDSFNRESDPRFLFLLSSKAGGVGINLIGGSRLIMCDCDWNPAIDAQAMARVWREGQKLPVFVYRLVAEGRIEDAILQRQQSKAGLASSVMHSNEEDNQEYDDNHFDNDGISSCRTDKTKTSQSGSGSKQGKVLSLTKKDVMMLLRPTPHPHSCDSDTKFRNNNQKSRKSCDVNRDEDDDAQCEDNRQLHGDGDEYDYTDDIDESKCSIIGADTSDILAGYDSSSSSSYSDISADSLLQAVLNSSTSSCTQFLSERKQMISRVVRI